MIVDDGVICYNILYDMLQVSSIYASARRACENARKNILLFNI